MSAAADVNPEETGPDTKSIKNPKKMGPMNVQLTVTTSGLIMWYCWLQINARFHNYLPDTTYLIQTIPSVSGRHQLESITGWHVRFLFLLMIGMLVKLQPLSVLQEHPYSFPKIYTVSNPEKNRKDHIEWVGQLYLHTLELEVLL